MTKEAELKILVQQKYSEIALQDKGTNQSSCCGAGSCSTEVRRTEGGTTEVYNIMSEDYAELEGYNADADLGLGCGLPTQFARIKKGDTVIDLGSGAGNDCFVARHETGETGKVIGIDFTPSMLAKARENAEKRCFTNVEFRQGDIEDMPIGGNIADVIVSNCVLNLVPNKNGVFKEIYRVLKPGGHFSISDIVLKGELPNALQEDAEMYAGCVAGAIQKHHYLSMIHANGFEEITVQKDKAIIIPADILGRYLSPAEIESFNHGETGIRSITVFARKPLEDKCCAPGAGCC